jgi:hypothetical protein
MVCPRPTSGLVALIVARTLSVLSVLMTVAAIDSWHVHYLLWGFEGTGYVAFISVVFAGLFALLALVIAVLRARSGTRAGFAQVLLLSAVSLLALGVLIAACPGGC